MFFYLAKIGGFFLDPANLTVVAVAVLAGLAWTRWARLARGLITALAAVLVVASFEPLSEAAITALETRFPRNPPLPAVVDGIVVLGGAIAPGRSARLDQPQLAGNAERLTAFLTLARRYPAARLVYTGGSGSLAEQRFKEADIARTLFADLGFPVRRIVFERESRNTYENAAFAKLVAEPAAGETWILVTSASHMPRAVGAFTRVGWRVLPYPVDYLMRGETRLGFDPQRAFRIYGVVAHEIVGLLAYYVAGYSESLVPGA